MIGKIYKYFFGPKTEIEYVSAALKRHKNNLQEMMELDDEFYSYNEIDWEVFQLKDKIKRVEEHLERLKKRKISK